MICTSFSVKNKLLFAKIYFSDKVLLWVTHQPVTLCTELLNYILNEVNRCLVIIIFSIIRLHVSDINGLNSINSVNGDFMIQYIELVSPGCRIVRPSSLTQESQKPPATVYRVQTLCQPGDGDNHSPV